MPLLLLRPTRANYVDVLGRDESRSGLVNSIKTTGLTTLLAILIGLPMAYALARLRFSGRQQMIF